MVIRRQPVISWLLEKNYFFDPTKISILRVENIIHQEYLLNGMRHLAQVREMNPNWGLPELLMPSFKKVMGKSEKSFSTIEPQLFQEFYREKVCGILIDGEITIVYGFGENQAYVWLFRVKNDVSYLCNYFYFGPKEADYRNIGCSQTILGDPIFRGGSWEERSRVYVAVSSLLVTYLAVKKYAKVETIVVPVNAVRVVEDTIQGYKGREKIRNNSGQEVIVMDSRWFVKIVNDNDIFVRGFFRLQNKKNELGDWYKELIFVDSYVRHGYHRNAKIEDNLSDK